MLKAVLMPRRAWVKAFAGLKVHACYYYMYVNAAIGIGVLHGGVAKAAAVHTRKRQRFPIAQCIVNLGGGWVILRRE